MLRKGEGGRSGFCGRVLVTALLSLSFTPVLAMVVASRENREQLLERADSLKASNYDESVAIVQRLGGETKKLSPEQQLYWRYLEAWQIAYRGNYQGAIPLLKSVADQSADINLRFRAGITEVNLLGIAVRYQEAFSLLSKLLNELPSVTDKMARHAGLFVASQLYGEAGQYDLALSYADRLRAENPTSEGVCKSEFLKLEALYLSDKKRAVDLHAYQYGADVCD